MSGNLKHLISSRGNYRGQVTKIHRDKDNLPLKTREERECISKKLNRLQEELDKLDNIIRELKWEDNSSVEATALAENDKEIDESTKYEDQITECLTIISKLNSNPVTNTVTSMLKSPTAPLPLFKSKEGEDLTEFFKQFEDTISHFGYTEFDKFLLLKQQISGKASLLLSSLDSSQHKYSVAKTLLQDALASPATRKFNVIRQMTNMKLEYNSEPFEYIGQLNSIHNSIKDLRITSEDILQYFAWTGLNERFKSHLINITNETKPTLEQIKEKFFDANERYTNSNKHYKSNVKAKENLPKEHTSFAASIQPKKKSSVNIFKYCTLCSEKGSHPVYKCPKYQTPANKIERIKILKGCIKCARIDHSADECKFHFNKRCYCGGWHFSFLCFEGLPDKNKPPSNPKSEPGNLEETTSSISTTDILCQAYEASDSSLAVLPTFSGRIQGGKIIRCMRDGGSQSNFIKEERAIRENLPIVKAGTAHRINGFNSSKIYHTNVYSVNLTVGGEDFVVEAIGRPEITINLNLPGLSEVVAGFQGKGYTLADESLTVNQDCITDIETLCL